jgi:hypothetical protein
VSAASGSYSRVSVQVGSDWQVRCVTPASQGPFLDIDAGQADISFGMAGQEIRASQVEFAAELARQASVFAAEVERRYADQQTGPATRAADAA